MQVNEHFTPSLQAIAEMQIASMDALAQQAEERCDTPNDFYWAAQTRKQTLDSILLLMRHEGSQNTDKKDETK